MENGLVIENISNKFKISYNKEIYTCDARGKLKNKSIKPVVGDKVNFNIYNKEEKIGVIEEILTRNNFIKRPKISNIDQIVLVISCKDPKPDLLMLDKQLAFAEFMNINPIIVVNKIDLGDINTQKIIDQYKNIGYSVIKTNAKLNEGIENLKKLLKNKVSVLSGNSGVGKSTLLNCLFNNKLTVEGNISKKNKRGKNTTTQVSLYQLEENSYIADTPGFSTFDIFEIESRKLAEYFKEFKSYIKKCEFVGCTHIKEQVCGIKEAVEKELISKDRYNRYIKIYEELKDKEEHKW